jgi:Polyketide cyclase / dehydrase and lipid transport
MPSRSIVINAPAEDVWTTLKSFSGNEKFNPMVTLSRMDGYGAGAKRTCYVSVDGGKTVSETIVILTSLNDHDRTMT